MTGMFLKRYGFLCALPAAFMAAFVAGYYHGRGQGSQATLKAAMAAYQTREKINDEVDNMDGAGLCLALGGVPDECISLMRRMDEAAGD